MFYDFALAIPAGRTKALPLELELDLSHGVLHRVEVEFPAGCVGQVFVIILYRRFQLYPLNSDCQFCSDDHVIAFDDYFELFEPPYKLTAIGWAPDTTYAHTIRLRFGVMPQSIAEHIFGRLTPREREDIRKALEEALIGPPEE